MTNHEMEVKYTKSKVILIEEAGTCRIPVPVDRCPINATREMVNFYLITTCLF